MAEAIVRLAYNNKAVLAATSITVSSESVSFPHGNLRDALPSRVWRSLSGWTVYAGFNDKIDFNRGGVLVATLTAGNYDTPTVMAAAIVAALEAADPVPVWACSYSTSTFKFTISSDLAFTLLFGSGANIATDIAEDIGFAAADTGSATSHTAGSASYQSRHIAVFNLGSALVITLVVAQGHNVSASGTITALAKASATVWSSPGFSQTLSGADPRRYAYFASQSFQYWGILLTDVQNSAGYGELAVPFIGGYLQLAKAYAYGGQKMREELTGLSYAIGGAHYLQERATRHGYSARFEYFPDSELSNLETFAAAVKLGKPFFFDRDAGASDLLLYSFSTEPLVVTAEGPGRWTTEFSYAEFLG